MALILDLVRHGHAASAASGGDPARPLTHAGLAAVRALARALPAGPEGPPRVFSSPLLRARQTAEALVREAGYTAMIELLPELGPDAEAIDVLHALAEHGVTEGHALLVGHMPLLGTLAGLLAREPLAFQPAQLARIECAEGARAGGGTLVLTVDPLG
jgi:phosphohistidine phosphatase